MNKMVNKCFSCEIILAKDIYFHLYGIDAIPKEKEQNGDSRNVGKL